MKLEQGLTYTEAMQLLKKAALKQDPAVKLEFLRALRIHEEVFGGAERDISVAHAVRVLESKVGLNLQLVAAALFSPVLDQVYFRERFIAAYLRPRTDFYLALSSSAQKALALGVLDALFGEKVSDYAHQFQAKMDLEHILGTRVGVEASIENV